MTFINELIPDEKKGKLKFPFHGNRATSLQKWTIDKARGVYLVKTETEGCPHQGVREQNTFYLHAYNTGIFIKATPWGTVQTPEGKWLFTWKVTALKVPNSIKSQEENIILLVKEAFAVLGCRYDGERYDQVNIEFVPEN